jgi:hypothetical protein
MGAYTFLSALPALLGLAGFVLYQLLGANRAGDEITRRIIDKLRSATEANGAPLDQRLTPKQLGRLLEQQQRLRKVVGQHDFVLLKQALSQQFVQTILVYVLTLGFCGWSVYLYAQPPTLIQKPSIQKSSGDVSPNVISNGPTTITIEGQPKGDGKK